MVHQNLHTYASFRQSSSNKLFHLKHGMPMHSQHSSLAQYYLAARTFYEIYPEQDVSNNVMYKVALR